MCRVAFFGAAGSHSHSVAEQRFGANAEMISCRSLTDVFERVVRDDADFGVVPLENSTAGSVHETYDLLQRYPIHMVAEQYNTIQHHLLVAPSFEGGVTDIKRVVSHPQAIRQCSLTLQHYPWIEVVSVGDTGSAARSVAEAHSNGLAAIAGRTAAKEYGLKILLEHVEDDPSNTTRFALLANAPHPTGISNKLSLILTLEHIPGALHHLLTPVAQKGLNISKIESRPLKGGKPFEYLFYLDLVCPQGKAINSEVYTELKHRSQTMKVIGFYEAMV